MSKISRNKKKSNKNNKAESQGFSSVQTNNDELHRLAIYQLYSKSKEASGFILRDIKESNSQDKFFGTFKRKDIINAMKDITTENSIKLLREASLHLYSISSHYRRLIEYFATMPLFYYAVMPLGFDIESSNKDSYKSGFLKAYTKTCQLLENMNIQHEFLKITSSVFTEDVFFGYEHSTKDSYSIIKLPSQYCKIVSIVDGVFQFAFNMSYFDKKQYLLETWGKEWETMFNLYKQNRKDNTWQVIPVDKGICIKLNENIYIPIIPFLGVFEEIYDLQDYKLLKKVREEIGNYKLVNLIIPLNDKSGRVNDFLLSPNLAESYYDAVSSALPENVGCSMSPMQMQEVNFKHDTSDNDRVAEAESKFWNSAGVSEFLFNSQKATAATLQYAITSDEMIVFKLLRQFERWVNYKLKKQSGKVKFKIKFLDITHFNKQLVFNQYLKAAQFGFPTKLLAGASLGMTNMDMDSLLYIENQMMGLDVKMLPLSSSHTQTDDGGRPTNKQNSDEGKDLTKDE